MPPLVVHLVVAYDDLAAHGDAVLAHLRRGDVTLELVPPGRPGLRLVDVLARLALAGHRAGGGRLACAGSPELHGLVALCGLAGLLPRADRLPAHPPPGGTGLPPGLGR